MSKNRIDKVDAMECAILEELGEKGMLEELIQALDYDTKKDLYEWIIRMWDIELEEVDDLASE